MTARERLPGEDSANVQTILPPDDILLKSLESLAALGGIDAACRLAGLACAAYRRSDMAAWKKFNGLLHRLCR